MSDTNVTINEKTSVQLFAVVSIAGAIIGALVWHLIFILGVSATASDAKAMALDNKAEVRAMIATQTAILVQVTELRADIKYLSERK